MSTLRFEAVQKRLGTRLVLQALDLNITQGELLVVVGASGAGKSTLLRLAAGLEQIDAGRVWLDRECVDAPGDRIFVAARRRHIGMVFQDFALWPHMNCIDNVAAAIHGGNRVEALGYLRRLGIAELALRRPGEISGGQQQRVGLARALASRPRVLLLDEPFSNLDVDTTEILRLEMLRVVRAEGMTTLLVSHDPTDAWRLADRIAMLEHGRLMQCASPTNIYMQPGTPGIARFTGAEGGFAAVMEVRDRVSGVCVAGHFMPATPVNVKNGDRCSVYIRAPGLRISKDAGVPCELTHCAFESGIYRAYWRMPDDTHWLCTLEGVPPPSRAMLRADPKHVFLYPEEGVT